MSRAIMQQAFDAFEDLKKSVTRDGTVSENWDAYYEKEYYALEALRQALAQPEQEPVAWMVRDQVDGCRYPSALKNPAGSINGESQPLYTSPRKEWVGLTGTEINHIFAANVGYPERMCRAIEAKLKEKNHG
jgi:hypothetical protein